MSKLGDGISQVEVMTVRAAERAYEHAKQMRETREFEFRAAAMEERRSFDVLRQVKAANAEKRGFAWLYGK